MQRLCDVIHHQEPCRSAWRSWGEGHKDQKLWIIFVKLTVWWFWPLFSQGDRPLQLHAGRLPPLVLPGPDFLTAILINFQESTKKEGLAFNCLIHFVNFSYGTPWKEDDLVSALSLDIKYISNELLTDSIYIWDRIFSKGVHLALKYFCSVKNNTSSMQSFELPPIYLGEKVHDLSLVQHYRNRFSGRYAKLVLK